MSTPPEKYDVFISYSHQDDGAVTQLCDELKRYGLAVFRDGESIKLGAEWRQQLASAIAGCRYFALVHSAAANSSGWVAEELSFAGTKLRKGWIRLDATQPNDSIKLMFGRFQACAAYNGDRAEKIREFAKSIYESLEPAQSAAPPTGSLKHNDCPYRGLSSYDGTQSDRLYGRGSEIGYLSEAIYQSVHSPIGSDRNANKRLFFVYGPSGTGKTSLISAGVMPALADQFRTAGLFRLSELNKSFVDYAKEADGSPCVIAIDQFEELWAESDKAIPPDLFRKINEDGIHGALNRYRDLVIVLSFREEYLAKMQELFQSMNNYLNGYVVHGLTREAAEECIRGPARECGIDLEARLVTALVGGLATGEDQVGEDFSRSAYVEPVELQIVCERLWRELPEGIPSIHSSHLRQVCAQLGLLSESAGTEKVDAFAAMFVDYATQGFLDSAVKMVSNTDAARACNYNDPDRIYFALLQFVSESNKRTNLKIRKDAGGEWVGRLPLRIVKELTDKRLLRAVNIRGEIWFELIHDRLAVPISAKKERLGLLYAVNSLDSAITKVKRERKDFTGWFENYEPLVKDLTDFKRFEGLNPEEAEFVLRSALVCDARHYDDLEAWTRTIAEQHPNVMTKVLHDAFSSAQQSPRVRINAAILLREQWLHAKLGSANFFAILGALELACRASDDDAQLEELCYTLACCPSFVPAEKCTHLNEVLAAAGDTTGIPSRNLLWMRDKVDVAASGCFAGRWKGLPATQRAWLTIRLCALRFKQYGVRIAFITIISTIFTSVGAAAMYGFWGISGSSFTQASASSGFAQGLFHGFVGGMIWGLALSLATLIYWLILRGQRIEEKFSHWSGGILLSTLAGILGGIALAFMILAVDTSQSMKQAGWIYDGSTNKYIDAFSQGDGGWIFPIYGAFLGCGVGWSMLDLNRDRKLRSKVTALGQLKSGMHLRKWISTVCLRVFVKSWPVAIGMAAAGVLVFALFHAKFLDCSPNQRSLTSRCQVPAVRDLYPMQIDPKTGDKPISNLEWRAAGTSTIIFFGAYSMMVGYLLALLAIRFGVEVPEDKSFLAVNR